MALIETCPTFPQSPELQIDHFGLSVGAVSVGLPLSSTTDTLLERYLDLVRLLQRGPEALIDPPDADVDALAAATNATRDQVLLRLRALRG